MANFKCSKSDKVLCGVCGGLGDTFGLNPWLFRILFLIFGAGVIGIIVYFIMAFISE